MFIQMKNFSVVATYAQMFQEGLVVTILLSLFTVLIGFVLALILAVIDLITIPFTFAALWQRVREIEKGELDEARKY